MSDICNTSKVCYKIYFFQAQQLMMFNRMACSVPNRTHSGRHSALSDISNRITGVKVLRPTSENALCSFRCGVYKYCFLVYKTGWCQQGMKPPGGIQWNGMSIFKSSTRPIYFWMYVGILNQISRHTAGVFPNAAQSHLGFLFLPCWE